MSAREDQGAQQPAPPAPAAAALVPPAPAPVVATVTPTPSAAALRALERLKAGSRELRAELALARRGSRAGLARLDARLADAADAIRNATGASRSAR